MRPHPFILSILLLCHGCSDAAAGATRDAATDEPELAQPEGRLALSADWLNGSVSIVDFDLLLEDDATREEAVVDAFIGRVKHDVANDEKLDVHSQSFAGALKRIRSDRAIEWQRHTAATDNVNLMREVGDGLRKLAVQSLLIKDEVKRYVTSLMDAKRKAQAAAGETR